MMENMYALGLLTRISNIKKEKEPYERMRLNEELVNYLLDEGGDRSWFIVDIEGLESYYLD